MSHGCPSTGAPSSRLRLTRKSIRTLGGRKWGRQPERCVFPLSYIVINPLPSHQSSPVLHCHIFSYHVLPCLFLSYLSLSCPPMSSLPSHVLPCPTLSSRVVSCPPLSSSFLLFPSLSFSFLLFPSHSSSVLLCPPLSSPRRRTGVRRRCARSRGPPRVPSGSGTGPARTRPPADRRGWTRCRSCSPPSSRTLAPETQTGGRVTAPTHPATLTPLSGNVQPTGASSRTNKHHVLTLNLRRAGGLCFPCRARGGGVFTPPLTRLLGHVATSGKRQSK